MFKITLSRVTEDVENTHMHSDTGTLTGSHWIE